MGRVPEAPEEFLMKDLFLDVRLEACVNGSTFDFLGKKLFSAEFFRHGVGFGITSIDIEINTSLQPLVTIVFKDLYGATIFGGQDRLGDDNGISADYSIIFNWPPPKFLFSFKGYLGAPATWLLNLKRTSTSFNSSDGSYDLKCEFVPNQWGFFADMPFLYLLAAKRLRRDRLSDTGNAALNIEQGVNVKSVFDLIKIGKQIEIKTQDTTKDFDDLVKKLGSLKSNLGRAMVVTNIVEFGEEIIGVANNQPVKDFEKIKIPSEKQLDSIGNRIIIESKLSSPSSLNSINAFLLLSCKIETGGKYIDGFERFKDLKIPKDYKSFEVNFSATGQQSRLDIDSAKAQTSSLIQKNLDKIDDEIKRRVFASSETKLEKITIGEIFSQIAKDSAFIMGSILDAGLDGYRGNTDRQIARDSLADTLIGESFPLMLDADGEEVPATKENLQNGSLDAQEAASSINVDNFEMKFVKDFISAISEGIAKDLLSNNPQSGEDDSVLKQRINNMEMSSGNPYKSYYTNIATNILTRGGIVAYFTRSSDPNLPGDYNKNIFRVDRSDINSIEEIAERDMQNVTDNIIKNLSDVDFLLLRRFCLFMTNYYTADANGIADALGNKAIDLSGPGVGDYILTFLTGGANLVIGAAASLIADGVEYLQDVAEDYGYEGEIVTSPNVRGEQVQEDPPPPTTPGNWQVLMVNPLTAEKVSAGTTFKESVLNADTPNPLTQINTRTKEANAALQFQTLTFDDIWRELYMPEILEGVRLDGDNLIFNDIEEQESIIEDTIIAVDNLRDKQNEAVSGEVLVGTHFDNQTQSSTGVRSAQNPLAFINQDNFTATRMVNNGIAYAWPQAKANNYYVVFFEGEDNKRAKEANSAPTDGEYKNENKDVTDTGTNEPLGYIPINAKYGDDGEATDGVDGNSLLGSNNKYILKRVKTLVGYRQGTYGTGHGHNKVIDFSASKNPSPGFYGAKEIGGANFATQSLSWNGAVLEDPADAAIVNINGRKVYYAGNIGFTVCHHLGAESDSALAFGLFSPSEGGRNHRAYVLKASTVLLEKIDKIIDERNQVIGEVLGKAGDSEAAIYKQMHTLFHQWQTLSYSDRIDGEGNLCGDVDEHKSGEGSSVVADAAVTGAFAGAAAAAGVGARAPAGEKVFNVAKALEQRFGDNHVDLNANELITVTGGEEPVINLNDCANAGTAPNGVFVYDYPMQRIREPLEPVLVKDSIISLEPLYKPKGNTSVLNMIQQVCTKNNFMFIPIPGNPGYLCVNDIYKPSMQPANLQIKNFFHVLFTPTPESRAKTKNTDGTPLGLSNKQDTYNVGSFVIKYGHPDNQIVKSISVGTDDNKVTAESIVNLQRLVDNENQNKKVTTDCSMLPVLAGRSYKASVDMLGNAQVYPMQFFFLENSPLFGGLYQVMKVKHSISPNDMSTSLDGIRMRFSPGDGYGSIKPITLQTYVNLGESEAPYAIPDGFDEADRKALKTIGESIGTVSRTANVGQYLGQDYVDGNSGGPVARTAALLPLNQLQTYDTSLGVRDLWSSGAIIGSEQMYIYDGYPMTAQVCSAYKAMKDAAHTDGVDLRLSSGYRDPFKNIVTSTGSHISSSQYSLRKANVIDKTKVNDDDYLRTKSSGKFKPATARPGYSNHNSGLAIDLNTGGAALKSKFNQPIYEWLMLHAYKFGFVRTVRSEEWHWEYRPGYAMFSFDSRNGKLWYGLPDKLGIPLNKPTSGSTGLSTGPLKDTLTADKKKTVDELIALCNQAGIRDKSRIFCILVVARKESNFTVKDEGFNYDLKRVNEIFGTFGGNNRRGDKTDEIMLQKYIPADRVPISTSPKHGSEKKLADLLYGGRQWNVDHNGWNYQNGEKEGWKYRGRGMSQITFKSNYKKMNSNLKEYFNETVDIVANPDLVTTKSMAMKTLIAGKLGKQFGEFNTTLDFLNSVEAIHRSNHGTNPQKEINQGTFKHTTDSYNQLKNDSYVNEKLAQFPDFA